MKSVDIRDWTFKKLTDEQRALAMEVAKEIVAFTLPLLDGNADLNDGRYVDIIPPHGGDGYEETLVIIDIRRERPGPGIRNPRDRLDSYLFFEDVVINRPNLWSYYTDDDGTNPRLEKGAYPEGRDNYEVGEEELTDLLASLKEAFLT